MKRKILFCICALMSLCSGAQILKDSTVQVVAYWTKGEAFDYKYYQEEFKVQGNDTIWGDWNEEVFRIEVVDSTENGYLMKYRCLHSEEHSDDKKLQKLLKPIQEKYSKIPIYFTTNPYGAFTGIARWEEFQITVDSIMNDVRKAMKEYLRTEEDAESAPEEYFQTMDAMIDQVIMASKSKEAIMMGMSYIIEPLYYHGGRMEQNKTYNGKEQFMSPWMLGEMLDGETELNIHQVKYDSSWATFHRTQRYDAGQLMDSFMRFLTSTLPPEQQMDLKPDELPFVMVETFFDLDVHLDSGWPGPSFYQKRVQTGDQQKVIRWWMEFYEPSPTEPEKPVMEVLEVIE